MLGDTLLLQIIDLAPEKDLPQSEEKWKEEEIARVAPVTVSATKRPQILPATDIQPRPAESTSSTHENKTVVKVSSDVPSQQPEEEPQPQPRIRSDSYTVSKEETTKSEV